MRDLKYLQYFEDLLQQANNALVEQAKADGKVPSSRKTDMRVFHAPQTSIAAKTSPASTCCSTER